MTYEVSFNCLGIYAPPVNASLLIIPAFERIVNGEFAIALPRVDRNAFLDVSRRSNEKPGRLGPRVEMKQRTLLVYKAISLFCQNV